ncbi:hypothetical protein CSQ85_11760 [Bifidobacterium rousetti]|uniref:hypothetical protein n=1 Tax=Bifidobacterium rousetti TaxID=2045439 RepID=UPI00123C0958|nr:hypothetical protein [Bifidobacterium rousetti]KAA8816095.1 hypothetical protein CSQ85_11760 [Bifidobacterium rousetti]
MNDKTADDLINELNIIAQELHAASDGIERIIHLVTAMTQTNETGHVQRQHDHRNHGREPARDTTSAEENKTGWSQYIHDQDCHPYPLLPTAPTRLQLETGPIERQENMGGSNTQEKETSKLMGSFYAQILTDRIKNDFYRVHESMLDLREAIADAYRGQAWIALGYENGFEGWKHYCEDNFQPAAMRLTSDEKKELVFGFDQGVALSAKALAVIFDVNPSTISRWRKPGNSSDGARPVQGLDGKIYTKVNLSRKQLRERNEKILYMSEVLHMREVDIAEEMGLSQSRVNEIKQNERRKQGKGKPRRSTK